MDTPISVKVSFNGEMRRFSFQGASFCLLNEQIVELLGLEKTAEIVLKYTDEEGDLITLSSDLELKSAIAPGQLLRLVVSNKSAPNPVVDEPTPTLAPPFFGAFANGCGGGWRRPPPPHMRGMHGEWDSIKDSLKEMSKEDRKEAKKVLKEECKERKEERKRWKEEFKGDKESWKEERKHWKEFKHGGRGHHHPPGFGPHPHPPHAGGPHHPPGFGPHPHPPHAGGPHHRGGPFGGPHHGGPHHGPHGHGPHHAPHGPHHGPHHGGPHGHGPHHAPHGPFGGPFGPHGPRRFGGWWDDEEKESKLIARHVKDVTVEDGTQMPPGTPFLKTWRLRNEGGVAWPAGCALIFVSKHRGDIMGGPERVPVTAVQPGEEVDVSVPLVAPAQSGRYTGFWRMCTPEGRKFGQRVWVTVVVAAPGGSSASSSEGEKEADKYEALVDLVLARGFAVKRHRVFRLLHKHNGDVEKVASVLAEKQARRASRID